MFKWVCKVCKQEFYTSDGGQPEPLRWSDGHVCSFVPCAKEGKKEEEE